MESSTSEIMNHIAVKKYYEKLFVGARSLKELNHHWNSMHMDNRILESQIDYLDGVYHTCCRFAPLKQFCEHIKDDPTIINATLMAAINECEI